MRKNDFTKQALPLPSGRILRFAHRHAYALSAILKDAHSRASHYAKPAASPTASFTASPDANAGASLMLRYP
jgi:hypothetical protein